MKNLLNTEIEKFKRWALSFPIESRSGEWECDYENWKELYSAFNDFILSTTPEDASGTDIENLIYVIARDNEMEDLILEIEARPEWFKTILPNVLESSEPDAKWQFAVALGKGVLPNQEAEPALLKLVYDKNEYVSRMALKSLGKIGSTKTEALCKRAWQTNHEYQRIMVLWVLKEIRSENLANYIDLAMKDGREHVVSNANEIRTA